MSDLETDPLKGTRDFYPSVMAERKAMFTVIRTLLESYGYEEYDASPLERSELYERKGNEEIVRDQTYSFEDRGGRRLTLRPEMTPTLARMVAAKRRELTFPLRWFSIGNRFRYERPQRGRTREFYQTDVDFIGLPQGEADIEILTLAYNVPRAFGATEKDFSIRINSRALLSAACASVGLTDKEGVSEYWQLLDRKNKMSKEEFEKLQEGKPDPLRAIEEATDPVVKEEKEKVLSVIETLKSRGITNVSFDPEIVRGFDYYTGIVFEIYDENPVNSRSLFGGGRYDGLVSMFGGDPIPAVGFAFSDVVFRDFLETHDLLPKDISSIDVYLGTPDPSLLPSAQEFATMLREKGVRVFVNLSERSLGDQVKEADRRGAPFFIAYGKDEVDGTTVKVKTLAEHSEKEMQKEEVAQFILG